MKPEGPNGGRGNPDTRKHENEQPFPPNDALGRVYTPPSLGVAVLRAIAARMVERDDAPPRTVLDPHAGRGDLLSGARNVWPGCIAMGIDIDPGAQFTSWVEHAMIADWLTVSRFWDRLPFADVCGRFHPTSQPDLVTDNPPFGKKVGIGVTIAHVLASLRHEHVVIILPNAYISGAEFDKVWRARRPSVVYRIPERPWPDRLREACAMEWDQQEGPTEIRTVPWKRPRDGLTGTQSPG